MSRAVDVTDQDQETCSREFAEKIVDTILTSALGQLRHARESTTHQSQIYAEDDENENTDDEDDAAEGKLAK